MKEKIKTFKPEKDREYYIFEQCTTSAELYRDYIEQLFSSTVSYIQCYHCYSQKKPIFKYTGVYTKYNIFECIECNEQKAVYPERIIYPADLVLRL